MTRPLSGREGVGALVAAFLLRLTRPDHRLGVADALRLETVLLDLIATLFAHATDAEDALPAETRQQVLALRIRSFISGRLHDPELTPAVIAAAHHISVSHLHRIFQAHIPASGGPMTVMGWVREQRLERARRDLGDPALRDRPVHAISYRWGFAHHATFSRVFRARYGMAPSECRHVRDAD